MSDANGDGRWALPEGWVWTTLGEACDINMGQSPPSSTYNTEGIGLPFYQGKAEFGALYPTPVKWCSSPQKISEVGDILLSVRAPVGATNVNKETSCIGRGLAAIKPPIQMSNLYFLYYLRYSEQNLIDRATGTTFQAVSGKVVRNHPIPLAPAPDQHRIVAEIEKQFTRLDAAVAALRRAKANLARYKAAVLQAAVEGRLVAQTSEVSETSEVLLARVLAERRAQWEAANPRKQYVEPKGPDVAGLPELPVGWVWASMEQLADIVSGVAKGRKFGNRQPLTLPYLRVANVQQGYLDLSEIKTIEALSEELEAYRLRKNDLLLTEGGDWDKLGRSAIWYGQIEDCIHQNHIFRARPFLSDLSSKWLMFATNSEHGRGYFAKSSKQTTNLASINLTQLRAFPVPIPPLNEQVRLIEQVESLISLVDAAEHSIGANLARADRLRQGVLGKAFRGELVANGETSEVSEDL